MNRSEHSSTDIQRAMLACWCAPDLLGFGVVISRADGYVLAANQAAQEVVGAQDGLRLTDWGYLSTTKSDQSRLSKEIQRCAKSKGACSGKPLCIPLAIDRHSIASPLLLLLRPLLAGGNDPCSGPMALILILNPGLNEKLRGGALYGFTTVQNRLVMLLADGHNLTACVKQLGCDRKDLDIVLDDMFKKTKTNSVVELVSVILRTSRLSQFRDAVPSVRNVDSHRILDAEREFVLSRCQKFLV